MARADSASAGRNGTFIVYRKLHQNVATFRNYLDEKAKLYGGAKEKLAAKFVGCWRDGTPIEFSPLIICGKTTLGSTA